MLNVFESVDQNRRRSAVVIIGFFIFTLISVVFISKAISFYYGFSASGWGLAGLALIISGISSFFSYYYSDRIILTLSRARPADKKKDFHFFTVTENLSLSLGTPLPRLFVIEDTAMNAFATGRDPHHAVICATTGLLTRLNRSELEGVIGHELSHVANYDTRLMSLVTVMVGMITLLGDWFVRATWFGGSRDKDRDDRGISALLGVLGLVFALLSPVIATLIQLAISRSREFYADAASVKLTRQPSGLISALTKLGADREPLEAANKATAHLYIVNPLRNRHDAIGWFSHLFSTHPPLADRIAKLQSMN